MKVHVNLDAELRKKYGRRQVGLRKGDRVKVMRGRFRGITGKVMEVDRKQGKVRIEEVETSKPDGSKVMAPIHFSNLQLKEINLEDKLRKKQLEAM